MKMTIVCETKQYMEEAEYFELKVTIREISLNFVNYYCPNDKKLSLDTIQTSDSKYLRRYGPPSKYISTCGSWEAMNSFRSNSKGRIVKIQKDKLPSSIKIIDLSREENRNQYIDNPRDENSKSKFHNFAKKLLAY
jgi:hypothetical protein